MLEPGFLFSLAVTLIGGVAWAVRVEGRVNGHDRLFEERDKALAERHTELQYRLTRIETKLDSLNEKSK